MRSAPMNVFTIANPAGLQTFAHGDYSRSMWPFVSDDQTSDA